MTKPSAKKAAIVGFSPSTREAVRQHIGDSSFEFHGMNSLWMIMPDLPWDYWYEIHHDSHLREIHKEQYPKIANHYKSLKIPLYTIREIEEFPTSTPYPLDDVVAALRLKTPYFESTVAYALAFVLWRHVTRQQLYSHIYLYGIDMTHDTEWGYQRPNTEFFLGVAHGMGINIIIPDGGALMTSSCLYGFDQEPDGFVDDMVKVLKAKEKQLAAIRDANLKQRDQADTQRIIHEAARLQMIELTTLLTQHRRGRDLEKTAESIERQTEEMKKGWQQ
jgi:hypothetical protein